ncbi:MAG: NADH-quinone oxidoreductase subunit L, partial [Alphaproteobacteria bacterium]|nr:NADH-quinone oxidoreductase subunit L [Alphaproteobacteria bacterium]
MTYNTYIVAVFAPLLGFLIVGSVGNLAGKRISGIVSVVLMAFSTLSAWHIFLDVIRGELVSHLVTLCPWIHVGNFKVDWQLYFDPLTATMVTVVTTVSFLVHLYSLGYMNHDKAVPRFMAYLSLFTFTMLMLVTSGNLIQLFFGWEGVGLASYLLIGFWHHKESANAAAMKAFIVNRVGDVGLALGIAALYLTFKTVDIGTILSQLDTSVSLTFMVFGHEFNRLEVIGILLFIGAMGKSAQLGLHTWLPDAMEGPTPVSALIHAATMVTAGVFLVARLSPLYELAPYARSVIIVIGASTALFAGTIALMQNDIKRVIAYSTCSQLGYMFFAAGLSAYNIAIFHLVTHAFFKALLFLGSGAVIHALSDEQDMRCMGGIWRAIPATYAMMWIGSLALAGIPFFAGFYSKDAILTAAWFGEGLPAKYAYLLGIGAAFLTALYSWRLLIMTFNGKTRADEKVLGHLHEPG